MSFWDLNYELKEVQRLEGHTDSVLNLAWRPITVLNGVPAAIASCGGDKTVRIWEQSRVTGSFQCKAVLEGVRIGTVRSCSWSPDSELLITVSLDAATTLWKEDAEGNFVCLSTLEDREDEVESFSWRLPGIGTFLATSGRGKNVFLWTLSRDDEGHFDMELEGHTQNVNLVQWHPSTRSLFSCSLDNTIKVWSDHEGEEWPCMQTLDQSNSGHSSTIWALSFNSTGDKMVSCSDDQTIKIWGCNIYRELSEDHCDPWRHLHTIKNAHDGPIYSVHWSREGIISSGGGDNAICLYHQHIDRKVTAEEGVYHFPRYLLKKKNAHDKKVNAVQWSPTENRCLASASDDGTIKIWELVSSPRRK